MPTGGTCPIGGGRGPIKWEGPVDGVFAAVMPGGEAMATPGGGVWFEVCEAEFVDSDGVRYSRSSSSRVTALEPGGKDGEPLACEAWKNSSRYMSNNKNYMITHVYHSIPLKTIPSNSLDNIPCPIVSRLLCGVHYTKSMYSDLFLRVIGG